MINKPKVFCTFCVLPWIHLSTHPNGGSSLCCRSNHTDAISWAKDSNGDLITLDNCKLEDIYNSDKFVEVRQKMMSGEKPIECEGCWADEAAGIESKRQYENNRWRYIFPKLETEAKLSDLQYKYVELRLGNVCNSACVTCNAYSSSMWNNQEEAISKTVSWYPHNKEADYTWFNDPDFYKDLLQHSNEVEEIYINGGEPTLIKAHYMYLEYLIDKGYADNIKLVYSLNMTSIPEILVKLWEKFSQVEVNASIDDIMERNYYIRYPTKWEDVLKSIDVLESLSNVTWNVTQTVSIFNVGNLLDLIKFLQEKYNKIPSHNYVLYPDYLSLAALPEQYKEDLIHKYENNLPSQLYSTLINKLSIQFDPNLLSYAKEFVVALDKYRGLTFKEYIPELRKFL